MSHRKKPTPDQVLSVLRQIDLEMAQGKTMALACEGAEISLQKFYRWRREYGSLQMDQTRRVKELEQENGKLKRQLLLLEKLTLKSNPSDEF